MQVNTKGDDIFRASDGQVPKTLSTQSLWKMEIK